MRCQRPFRQFDETDYRMCERCRGAVSGLAPDGPRFMPRAAARTSVAIALLACVTAHAVAAPPPNADPALRDWYEGLRSPSTGVSCCSVADCRPTDAYELIGSGWRVERGGVWYNVPPETVIAAENPTGRAVACVYGAQVHCFVAPSMG